MYIRIYRSVIIQKDGLVTMRIQVSQELATSEMDPEMGSQPCSVHQHSLFSEMGVISLGCFAPP